MPQNPIKHDRAAAKRRRKEELEKIVALKEAADAKRAAGASSVSRAQMSKKRASQEGIGDSLGLSGRLPGSSKQSVARRQERLAGESSRLARIAKKKRKK